MSLATLAHRHPRIVDWGIHIDRTPAAAWLALQFAALAPTWAWMVQRMRDGSDDPLGLVALVALAALAWQCRRELRASPRLGWLALAGVGTVLATVLRAGLGVVPALPPLAAGLVAVLALACGLLAFLPRRVAALPVVGLAVLALPLLSSLQFYAGYPLRVVTAEASRWLLAPGFDVAREGTSLMVDGRLVIVDAPCSGVQMVWLGYFAACAVALWARCMMCHMKKGGEETITQVHCAQADLIDKLNAHRWLLSDAVVLAVRAFGDESIGIAGFHPAGTDGFLIEMTQYRERVSLAIKEMMQSDDLARMFKVSLPADKEVG